MLGSSGASIFVSVQAEPGAILKRSISRPQVPVQVGIAMSAVCMFDCACIASVSRQISIGKHLVSAGQELAQQSFNSLA